MFADLPSVGGEPRLVKARKNYECCDCWICIPKGVPYYSTSGKWDGDWETFRMCETCHDFRNEIGAYGDEGAPFNYLEEFAEEQFRYQTTQQDIIRKWLTRFEAIELVRKKTRRPKKVEEGESIT